MKKIYINNLINKYIYKSIKYNKIKINKNIIKLYYIIYKMHFLKSQILQID